MLDGTTDDTAHLVAAIAAAHAGAAVLIDGPAFIAHPAAITLPAGTSLMFRGEGRLITAFGSVRSIRIDRHGAGYTSVPAVAITGSARLGTVSMGFSQFELAAPGAGYVPGDILTLQGGKYAQPAKLAVVATQVVSARIVHGGSGGTDGVSTVTGTSGDGVPFQASVTISGGALRAVNAITAGGHYTRNPANLASEPVAGANLTGATLALSMGVGVTTQGKKATTPTAYVADFGSYIALPTGEVPLSGGTGSGARLAGISWHVQSIAVIDSGSYPTAAVPVITFSGGSPAYAAQAVAQGERPVLDGPVIAPATHVFDGYSHMAGTFGGTTLEAVWFGADRTAAIDSTFALQAWAASVPSPGGNGHCGAGTYLLSGTVLQRSGTTLAGEGAATTWKAAPNWSGGNIPGYAFPFAGIDNTMIANEHYDVPFNAANKVDKNLTLRNISFDYSGPASQRISGDKAIIYRMVRNATLTDIRCFNVGDCTAMLGSDTTKVIRLYARGVSNAAADHWESPTNALVEDPDIDMAGDPFGKSMYGVLFTATDTATRFGLARNNTVRGGRIAGFTEAAIWADNGNWEMTVENTAIDCRHNGHGVGIFMTGSGGQHKISRVAFSNCTRPAIYANPQKDASPDGIDVSDVRITGQSVTAPIVLNAAPQQASNPARHVHMSLHGVHVDYAPGSERPPYTVVASPGGDVAIDARSQLSPGKSGAVLRSGSGK
ncbi:glycoside hydrolase family protein [Limobrevibacterium gyesilva]|uniref:Uncharacterized protein n=1 Tax=Limobrevibacterium gyesilva TaxID=2991712 RepID=A0AA41YU14_9PROT|nr:hypothetical protein [Limobrevibacterium gyesilva]MCW3476558.1 hypothetical protein [Limobrevibacterium gyesilva]